MVSVFDLSADFRLKDPVIFEQWYKTPHTAVDLLEQAFFGLPEITEAELLEARDLHAQHHPTLVACAGCYLRPPRSLHGRPLRFRKALWWSMRSLA